MSKLDSAGIGINAHPEVTKRISDYLAKEVREGRAYFRAKYISEALDLTTHAVGTRMGILQRCGARGIRVTKFSDKIWRVEICYGCRDVRETPNGV
jgi:hypothetical protein